MTDFAFMMSIKSLGGSKSSVYSEVNFAFLTNI